MGNGFDTRGEMNIKNFSSSGKTLTQVLLKYI